MESQPKLFHKPPKTPMGVLTYDPWIEREVGAAVARWPLDCYPVTLYADKGTRPVLFNSPKEVMAATL